jgi:hypothetical protein
MAIEQDPKRLSRADVIAYVSLAVGLLSLAVGVISYIRPPDPAHPLRFDFLLQRVSFPLWGTVLGVIAIAGGSYGIGVRKSRKGLNLVLPVEPTATRSVNPRLPATQPSTKAIPAPLTARIVSQCREEFALETPDHYIIRIRRHLDRDTNGLVMSIDNNRLETLGKVVITIFTAQSFSARHGEFREPWGFPAARMVYQGTIPAETSGLRFWIVRKEESKGYLLAADDQSHIMNWPDNDPVELQTWRLKLEVTSQTVPVSSGAAPKAFSTQPFNIVVVWNSATNEFFIEPESSKEKP